MIVTQAHALPLPTALEKLKSFPAQLRRKFAVNDPNATEVWAGNVLTYGFTGPAGNHFTGTVTVRANSVEVVVESPVLDGFIPRRIANGQIKVALAEALGS